MKKIIISLIIISFSKTILHSQEYKHDRRNKLQKENNSREFNSDKINNLDLIQALTMSGITINKFDLGKFDKKYNLSIIADEYKDGKIIHSETIMNPGNTYIHFKKDGKKYYTDYIDQIKIFTKVSDSTLVLNIKTYAMEMKRIIDTKKYSKDSFYNLRNYTDTQWVFNEKIPLLLFGSSWKDGKINRFCGVNTLKKDDKNTNELLKLSPHYYIISYLVN